MKKMGRPSKAKLLEITLKLQQNLCANCSVPLTEINEKITKISCPYSKFARKANKLNHRTKKDLPLCEALLTVFEAAFKINKITISATDTILYMCKHCASSLSELYWTYKTFLEITKQESYIRAAIKTCLLWEEKKNSEPENESPITNYKLNTNENSGTEKDGKSNETDKESSTRGESLTKSEENSEIESDHEFFVDPKDDDNLPESKSKIEAVSTVSAQKLKTERKQCLPSTGRKVSDDQQINSGSVIQKTPTHTRKCKSSEQRMVLRKRPTRNTVDLAKKSTRNNKKENNIAAAVSSKTKKKSIKQNVCKVCCKLFDSLILLKSHSIKCKKKVRSSSQFCRYCGKKFSLKLLRDRHEGVFHSKEQFQKGENLACKECGKTFKNLTFLRRHASVHSTAKPFQCETCLRSFKRLDTLQEHQRIKSHTLSMGPKSRPQNVDFENKTYPCKICNQVFKHKVSLFRHESKLHMEERPFGCEQCWKRYRDKEKLANHLKTHENRKEKERVIYKCDLCDKTYTYLYSYKAHVITHVIDKPFLCSQCGNSFRQKQGFLRHMSTMHKTENRHICSVCGKSFKRKDHLTQHLRGKTHGKPLKEKKLKKNEDFTSNVISHTNMHTYANSKPCQSANLTTPNHFTNTSTENRTTSTTIIIESTPSSTSNNFLQTNIIRPGVIVPTSHCNIETHHLQNSETTNQPPSGQPASFTFTASNLFFDF